MGGQSQLSRCAIGVALNESADGLGQKYVTPEVAIGENQSDVIIVGRAILNVSSSHYMTVSFSKIILAMCHPGT